MKKIWAGLFLLAIGVVAIAFSLSFPESENTKKAIENRIQDRKLSADTHSGQPDSSVIKNKNRHFFEEAKDDDPTGDLVLEGQVLQDGLAVQDATVIISTRPERSARTDQGGSFSFAGLIGRRYVINARKGSLVGGPVVHNLSWQSVVQILCAE